MVSKIFSICLIICPKFFVCFIKDEDNGLWVVLVFKIYGTNIIKIMFIFVIKNTKKVKVTLFLLSVLEWKKHSYNTYYKYFKKTVQNKPYFIVTVINVWAQVAQSFLK